jgi:hypothetical protein
MTQPKREKIRKYPNGGYVKETQIDDGVIGLEMDNKGFMAEFGKEYLTKLLWEEEFDYLAVQWDKTIAHQECKLCDMCKTDIKSFISKVYQQAYDLGFETSAKRNAFLVDIIRKEGYEEGLNENWGGDKKIQIDQAYKEGKAELKKHDEIQGGIHRIVDQAVREAVIKTRAEEAEVYHKLIEKARKEAIEEVIEEYDEALNGVMLKPEIWGKIEKLKQSLKDKYLNN